MNLTTLEKFAQDMRRAFMSQIASRLEYVLSHDDEYLRAHASEKHTIIKMVQDEGREAVIEKAAYLWFNRLAAFRYMDARGYTSPRVVSPRPGETQPELLAEIKRGNTPKELKQHAADIEGFLSGRIRSAQPDREVYKLALLGTCNAWATRMPWLFAKVEDWVGLLLPQDLLSADSLVARMADGMSDSDCAQGVEIIGWLYQFYISEKKDQVYNLLKKNVKVSKENIPAATQLFTPHWIVRFMVENSLGRLWLLNRPDSRLKDRMKYYIESDPEPDYLKVKDPTELKCLDPCCGSGHVLAYFFELLYAIYEEEGYAPQEIPSLIIQHNIYGIDIDERAAELAAFTLAMVAREKDRRFFERGVTPHVTAMRDIQVDLRRLNVRLSPDLQESLELFKEGRNYGSLISVPAGAATEIAEIEAGIENHRFDDLFDRAELDDLKAAFRILEYLEPRYHVVVTNPPYMGSKGMNETLKEFVNKRYPYSKSDLFAVFMERSLEALHKKGYMGMINQQSWMFLSSYEDLRKKILQDDAIIVMAHLGPRAFKTIGGEVVQTTSFVLSKQNISNFQGSYVRLINYSTSEEKETAFLKGANRHRADQRDFSKIPGSPIAYWVSEKTLDVFQKYPFISSSLETKIGLQTGNNERFLKLWFEVSNNLTTIFNKQGGIWNPILKGGTNRKFFGENMFIVKWGHDGQVIKDYKKEMLDKGLIEAKNSRCWNEDYYTKMGISWTRMASGFLTLKYKPCSYIFETGGPCFFSNSNLELVSALALLNSKIASYFITFINPTLSIQSGDIEKLPFISISTYNTIVMLSLSKSDWDLRETSWDFRRSPLLTDYGAPKIETVIDENLTDWSWPSAFAAGKALHLQSQAEAFKRHWTALFLELHKNEEENNRIFIDLYGLRDELTPEVPYSEITILQEELSDSARRENRVEFDDAVLARQFVSYGVGCLMGRYSAEQDGLILADAGATLNDFLAKVPSAQYLPDDDGILPLTDEDDFPDDLPTRFKAWLRFISGSHYEANLRWLEERLGKDLRTWFLRDFYKDHLRRYKNRPIYWMISSPTGVFRALIYLHRYTKDTVGKVLNDYLRPYRTKIEQKLRSLAAIIDSALSTQTEKTKARKRYAQLEKYLSEIDLWEKKHVYPLALQRIELDLDDGVKVNYRKLSSILEPVKQLEAKEEE